MAGLREECTRKRMPRKSERFAQKSFGLLIAESAKKLFRSIGTRREGNRLRFDKLTLTQVSAYTGARRISSRATQEQGQTHQNGDVPLGCSRSLQSVRLSDGNKDSARDAYCYEQMHKGKQQHCGQRLMETYSIAVMGTDTRVLVMWYRFKYHRGGLSGSASDA